jgi:phytoene desaturase
VSKLSSVIVVGGGLAGLAAAVELASNGLAVTLVERNNHLGGKMNVLQERGYTFDMGPTILTLPQVLCGIIERSGRRVQDYLQLINLDPQWRCFYEDGAVIDLWQDQERLARELEAKFPGAGAPEGLRKFVDYSRRMLRLSEKVFFFKDLGGVGDLIRRPPPNDPAMLRDVLAMRMHSTVGATAHSMIREPHVRQLVEHFLQYVGSSPFLAPAILSLIAAAQLDHGCCYAMGGTRQVARSLERVARELGVQCLTGVGVRSLKTQGSRATGVELEDGRVLTAEAVVSNCDVQRTYRDLLNTPAARSEAGAIAGKYRPACSGLVLYLGLDRRYEHLAHHNFMFSRSSDAEFADLYQRGLPAQDPTLYLAAPSRTDETQAPPGCEALYVLIHTPARSPEQNWHGPGGILETYRPVVLSKLTRMGMPDIESHIVIEKHLTPNMIDRMYNAEGGAIYGLASHGRLKGGFKPRNRSRVLDNLYLSGGSVNPGPGVPMVLMSGVTAAWSLCDDAGISVRGREAPTAAPRMSRVDWPGASASTAAVGAGAETMV